jgi:hypothetical protein
MIVKHDIPFANELVNPAADQLKSFRSLVGKLIKEAQKSPARTIGIYYPKFTTPYVAAEVVEELKEKGYKIDYEKGIFQRSHVNYGHLIITW